MRKNYWIASPRFDLTWIVGPHFLAVILVWVWSRMGDLSLLPLWAWIFAVMAVDVAHVYATLFRSYLHREGREKWGFLLIALPIAVFLLGFLVYKISGALLYWRILAYIATFHFIRQQYGFFRIYVRKDPAPPRKKRLDEIFLYSLMVLPLIYWHTHLPRNFDWFVEGDFVRLPQIIWSISVGVWFLLAVTYVVSEFLIWRKARDFNLPKNMLFLGTGFSWMVGIIYFNGDFAFTLTNTFSHGIPYMALVAWTSHQTYSSRTERRFKLSSFALAAGMGLVLLWLLAYVEEGLWDRFVWHEREILFRPFSILSGLGESLGATFWVALLSVPQITHYILDGFIWKLRDPQRDFAAALK